MPFEPPSGDETKPPEQIAADQAAKEAATKATATDHTSAFLVAGDRAFRDADSVVKNIESAQSHIATLEAERKADRERLASQDAEIERLKKIVDGLDGRDDDTGKAAQTEQLSKDELVAHAAKLAVGMIAQTQTETQQAENLAGCEAAAAAAYGKDSVQKVAELAASLKMSLAQVDALGKESPEAFARLFLPKDPGAAHQPSQGTVIPPAGVTPQRDEQPVNIVKMSERDRIQHVAAKMAAAGVGGYSN
jgi:hypothetical protein